MHLRLPVAYLIRNRNTQMAAFLHWNESKAFCSYSDNNPRLQRVIFEMITDPAIQLLHFTGHDHPEANYSFDCSTRIPPIDETKNTHQLYAIPATITSDSKFNHFHLFKDLERRVRHGTIHSWRNRQKEQRQWRGSIGCSKDHLQTRRSQLSMAKNQAPYRCWKADWKVPKIRHYRAKNEI